MKTRGAVLAAALLFAGIATLRADATGANPSAAPVTDPAQIAAHYREVVARPEFKEPAEPEVGDQMKNWLAERLARFGAKLEQFRYAQEMPRFTSLLITFLVGAALLGLLYVLARLVRGRMGRDPAVSPEAPGSRVFQPPEFYEAELRRAIEAHDWHAAWLASWRQFLSRLEDGQLVAADRTRTNREYLSQLHAQPQTGAALLLIRETVDAYDAFIYGRRSIAESDWRSFQGKLEEAGLMLHLIDWTAGKPVPAA